MPYRLRPTKIFTDWLDDLRDDLAVSAIAKRLARIQLGNFGDYKAVGNGVSELRIQHGPGYRIYFQIKGNEIVLLLCGGDKSSQQRDIERAKQLAKAWDH
jgi:putative addiction module killer protein